MIRVYQIKYVPTTKQLNITLTRYITYIRNLIISPGGNLFSYQRILRPNIFWVTTHTEMIQNGDVSQKSWGLGFYSPEN